MFHNNEIVDHLDNLRKFARRLAGNIPDAEDLVQATVLRTLEKKDLFREDSNLLGWMSKIMFNLFVSQYRRKKKFETKYDPDDFIRRETIEPVQDKIIEAAQVAEAINLLPKDQKEILILICVRDFKYQDAADFLSIPVGTVRSRLARARKGLKNILDNSGAKKDIAASSTAA